MSIINKIINSIEHYIAINPDIKSFVYSDNTLYQEFDCNVKVNLTGTETQFIIQNNGLDITSTEYPNFLLYRYLEFNGDLRQIIDYDNLTGRVTINSPFGYAITTTDSLTVKIIDSIFIYEANSFDDRHGTNIAQKSYIPIYFRVTTKEDIKAERNKTIIDDIKSIFYSNNFNLKIYEDNTFTTYKSMTTIGNISFNTNMIDIKNNDYTSLNNILLSYYITYK